MKSFFRTGIVTACLLALSASTLMAQPEGRGRGQRGGRGGLGGLLLMSEVQKELKLSEDDVAKLTKALEDLRPSMRGPGGGNNQDPEAFRKQMDEVQKKIDAKVKESISADQWKRLNELRLQREGAASVRRPEVAAELKLTDEQKSKLKPLLDELRPQFGGGRGRGENGGGQGNQPNFEEMREKRDKASAEILGLLTPEQKKTWEALQGAKFAFPERGRGGAGGRPQRPAAE